MIFAPDEIARLPGRQLLASLREVVIDEDERIRIVQAGLVAEGLRRRPEAQQLDRAARFHAIDQILEHAIRSGPDTTVKALTQAARDAWRSAALRGQIDASSEEEGGERGDEGDDPPPLA